MRLPRDISGEDLAFPLRIGTLAAILADIAHHHGLSREALVERLFRT